MFVSSGLHVCPVFAPLKFLGENPDGELGFPHDSGTLHESIAVMCCVIPGGGRIRWHYSKRNHQMEGGAEDLDLNSRPKSAPQLITWR